MAEVKKMTVKILAEEIYKLRGELKEYSSIQKKVSELESALEKSSNDTNDPLKVIKALERKVEHLQKAVESESDDPESIPITNDFACRKCDIHFENKSEMKKHMK